METVLLNIANQGKVALDPRELVDVVSSWDQLVTKRADDCNPGELVVTHVLREALPLSIEDVRKALRGGSEEYRIAESYLFVEPERSATTTFAAAILRAVAKQRPDVFPTSLDQIILDLNLLTETQERTIFDLIDKAVKKYKPHCDGSEAHSISLSTIRNWLYGASDTQGEHQYKIPYSFEEGKKRPILRPHENFIAILCYLDDAFKEMGNGSNHHRNWQKVVGWHQADLHDLRAKAYVKTRPCIRTASENHENSVTATNALGILWRIYGGKISEQLEANPITSAETIQFDRRQIRKFKGNHTRHLKPTKVTNPKDYSHISVFDVVNSYHKHIFEVAYRVIVDALTIIYREDLGQDVESYEIAWGIGVTASFRFLNSLFHSPVFPEHRFRDQYFLMWRSLEDLGIYEEDIPEFCRLLNDDYNQGKLDNPLPKCGSLVVDDRSFEGVPTIDVVTQARFLQKHFPKRYILGLNQALDSSLYEILTRKGIPRPFMWPDGTILELNCEPGCPGFDDIQREFVKNYKWDGRGQDENLLLEKLKVPPIETLVKGGLADSLYNRLTRGLYLDVGDSLLVAWRGELFNRFRKSE